jgi:HAD superfamily hydrolase (TIGR01509 family)
MIKAFIFDFDGTLLDSMRAWRTLGTDYLASKGVREIPETLMEHLRPMTLLEAAEYFSAEFSFGQTPEQILAEFNELIAAKYRHEFLPKPGAAEFLEKHRGMKMCVATATERALAEPALERLGWTKYFEFMITSGETGSSKRSPDIFLQAAERLGVSAREAAVFEDAPHAIKTAKAAGFYTVAVWDESFRHLRAEMESIADVYVENLNDFVIPASLFDRLS